MVWANIRVSLSPDEIIKQLFNDLGLQFSKVTYTGSYKESNGYKNKNNNVPGTGNDTNMIEFVMEADTGFMNVEKGVGGLITVIFKYDNEEWGKVVVNVDIPVIGDDNVVVQSNTLMLPLSLRYVGVKGNDNAHTYNLVLGKGNTMRPEVVVGGKVVSGGAADWTLRYARDAILVAIPAAVEAIAKK